MVELFYEDFLTTSTDTSPKPCVCLRYLGLVESLFSKFSNRSFTVLDNIFCRLYPPRRIYTLELDKGEVLLRVIQYLEGLLVLNFLGM